MEEGQKIKPCVIVLAVKQQHDTRVVTVAPVRHRAPSVEGSAVEIPQREKQHLGLDDERSWVVVSEVNQFTWRGYDLHAPTGNRCKIGYGFLPPKLFDVMIKALLKLVAQRATQKTIRD